PGLRRSLWGFATVLSLASGHFGHQSRAEFAAVVGVAILTAAVLGLVAWVRRPSERSRLLGLAAVLLGVLALSAAVGHSRTWFIDTRAFALHYVLIPAPLLAGRVPGAGLFPPPRPGAG